MFTVKMPKTVISTTVPKMHLDALLGHRVCGAGSFGWSLLPSEEIQNPV